MPWTSQSTPPACLSDARGFIVEYRDEFRANPFSLCFWIGDAGQLLQKSLARINGNYVQSQLVAQIFLHADEFVFPQDSVIHKDASELAANRHVHQHCRDRGIYPARQPADHVPLPDLFADPGDCGLNEVLWSPVPLRAADIEDEITEQLSAEGRVMHFGVKLYRPDATLFVCDTSQRI